MRIQEKNLIIVFVVLLQIETDKIKENAFLINKVATKSNIKVMGVTKSCMGDPRIANAMSLGGINRFGDARSENLLSLNKHGYKNLSLIKQPTKDEIEKLKDIDINYFISTINAAKNLSKASNHKPVRVTVMIETGDGREGFLPTETSKGVEKIKKIKDIKICGIATNIGCVKKDKNREIQMEILINTAKETSLNGKTEISGANSSNVPQLLKNKLPDEITEIRVGEAILLGQEPIDYKPVEGCHQDAFIVKSEVLESRVKYGKNQALLILR